MPSLYNFFLGKKGLMWLSLAKCYFMVMLSVEYDRNPRRRDFTRPALMKLSVYINAGLWALLWTQAQQSQLGYLTVEMSQDMIHIPHEFFFLVYFLLLLTNSVCSHMLSVHTWLLAHNDPQSTLKSLFISDTHSIQLICFLFVQINERECHKSNSLFQTRLLGRDQTLASYMWQGSR